MNVSLFPSHRRTHRTANQSRSKRDIILAELLQSLRGITVTLDDIYSGTDLSLLNTVIADMQLELLQTSEYTLEGVIVRHRCQQLFQNIACRLVEVADDIKPDPSTT